MISKVVAKNFLSWGAMEFDFKSGVTLIDGWNEDDQTSEGSGKSSIPNAVVWGLYGKIPKDANIDDVIKEGEKECFVEVHFDDRTIIKRSRHPNDLVLLKYTENAWNHVKGKDARETQTIIEEYLGLSFETFCQTIYFAQNYLKKFITSNQEEKGKILSEVQDLGLFDKAIKEVKSLLKTEDEFLTKMEHQAEILVKDQELTKRDISAKEMVIQHAHDRRQQQLDQVQARIDEAKANVQKALDDHEALRLAVDQIYYDENEEAELSKAGSDLAYQISVLNGKSSEIDKLVQKKLNAESQGRRYSARYKQLEADKTKTQAFIDNPTKDCPTCGTLLENCDTSHALKDMARIVEEQAAIVDTLTMLSHEIDVEIPTKEQIEAELSEIRRQRGALDGRLKEIKIIKDRLLQGQATLKSFERNANTYQAEADRATKTLEQLRAEPLNLDTSELDALKDKLQTLYGQANGLDGLMDETTAHVHRLNVLKDGFREIKSYVFNSILNEVNARVQKYLSHLFEVPITVRFVNDEMKIETSIVYDGVPRGLGLLSGGQARRVALAVDLALSDVITARKGSRVGLLILDEYFKDLSETSMEKCLSLLESRGQPVILIEHNSIFKNIVTNSVTVKLENGTSRIETRV